MMKRPVRYILAGLLALLGFSSCASLREAREERSRREREAFEAQQRALVEQELQRMMEEDARNPEKQIQEEGRSRHHEEQRAKLLYAVPNAPYRVK